MPEASTSAAGLAIVKAAPIVFGVVVVVAIGVLAYQLFKPNKEKKCTYSSNRSTRSHESSYYYDPESKTITDSAAPLSNTSENNLRKRQVTRNASSTSKKNPLEASSDKKSNAIVSTSVQTDPVDNNQNIDVKKVLPEKNLVTPMSVEEKVNEYFRRNNTETDSTESNLSKKSKEKKLSNAKQVRCCDNSECESHSAEDLDDTLSSSAESSSWSNISLEKSTGILKRSYIEEMCRVLNEDLNDMNKTEASRSPSVCSVTSIVSESSVGTLLSGESDLCRGCEQNPVNTHTQPCNHRYMCSDCAMKIFRLFKRCKVCRAKIERIVVAE